MDGRYPIDPADHFDFDMNEIGGRFDIMPIAGLDQQIGQKM